MPTPAGKFDHRITIQVATKSRDNANDEVVDWTSAAPFKLWASKSQNQGFETIGAQELVRSADTVFEIRRSPVSLSIRPETHRIVHDETIFTIVGIQEGKTRGETLKFLTSSRPDGQGARGRGQTDNV